MSRFTNADTGLSNGPPGLDLLQVRMPSPPKPGNPQGQTRAPVPRASVHVSVPHAATVPLHLSPPTSTRVPASNVMARLAAAVAKVPHTASRGNAKDLFKP